MSAQRTLTHTFAWALLLLTLFGVLKHLAFAFPYGPEVAGVLAMAFQLYVPLWLIAKEGSSYREYGIYFYGIFEPGVKIDWPHFWADLRRVFWYALFTFVPYAAIYHVVQITFASRYGFRATFALDMPSGLWQILLVNLLVVALPEELFYRGFLQTRLLRVWPNRLFVLGLPVGRAIIITSILFALGHFIGEYHPARLLPFFPAIIFSALAYYSKSIMGAVVYHALCNTFSEVLQSSYTWS